MAMGRRIKASQTAKTVVVWSCHVAAVALFAFGAYVFVTRRFYEEMFLLTNFKLFDYDKTVIGYLAETFSLSSLFVGIAYYGKKWYTQYTIRKKKKNKKQGENYAKF